MLGKTLLLSEKLVLVFVSVYLSGCSIIFNRGLNPEQFSVGSSLNLGQEMLICMKPSDPWVPGELGGILDDAASLDPLRALTEADPVKKIPLLASVGGVTDFTDNFFSLMPELYVMLYQDTAEKRGQIYTKYLQAYFSQNGFVSRSGLKLKFPGIPNLSLEDKPIPKDSSKNLDSPSSVDFTQVGTDIVRVFLEALRDASLEKDNRLPGVADSTGVIADILIEVSAAPQWNVPTKDFAKIESRASQAEGMMATAVGKVARGGSWGSLNNEAVAKVAETVAGVEARYTVERFEWCKAKTEKPKE